VGYIERFEHAYSALREQRAPCRSLAFTEAGLVLGAGTLVAPMRRGGGDTLDLSGEDRILALLSAAFSAPVDAAVLVKLRHAAELWAQGNKCLEHLRLPKLAGEEQAFRLFLADHLIASGQSPRDLCKALGFDLPEGLKTYNPDEPRDDHGRRTTGGEDAVATITQPAAATDVATGPDLNPAQMSYEFSGSTASQTSTNPDGTSVVSTWTLTLGSGLTQTDQIRLTNGDIAATSVTDSKATQTLALSEAGAEAGLVIAQPPAGDPILIPAGTAASTGATTLLDEAGPIITNIGRWFLTAAGPARLFISAQRHRPGQRMKRLPSARGTNSASCPTPIASAPLSSATPATAGSIPGSR
jgi:hypothetical protein